MEYLTIPAEQDFKKSLYLSFDVAIPNWRQYGFKVFFNRYSAVGCMGCLDVELSKGDKKYVVGLIITADKEYYDVYANVTELVMGRGNYPVHKAITTVYSPFTRTLLLDADFVALASARICEAAMLFLASTEGIMNTKVKIAPPYIPPNMEMGVLMHSTFPAVRETAEALGLSFTYYKYLCDWEYGTLIIRVHGAAEYSVKANFDIDGENYRVETDIALVHPVKEGEVPRYSHIARLYSGERANSPDTLARRIGVQFIDAIKQISTLAPFVV